jgi:3-oxoacyl-[acyl-carrier-protein] synthase-3
MATTIEGIEFTTGGWHTHRSALRLAVAATEEALRDAGCKPGEVDLLINAGLYHDRNLGEPALAPLIQEDAAINPGDPHPGGSGSFSFDVANGGCGVLTGLQIASGFLASRTIGTAVVVASDADPGRRLAPGFPFEPAAGALVCRWTDDDRGLNSFRWRNRPDDGTTFHSTIGLDRGRNTLTITEDPSFAEQVGELAAEVAREVLESNGMTSDHVDLIVASPARPAFTKTLSAQLGIPDHRIITEGPALHTVAFVAALEGAIRQGGHMPVGTSVLFVCGSAGLTAGAALYRA